MRSLFWLAVVLNDFKGKYMYKLVQVQRSGTLEGSECSPHVSLWEIDVLSYDFFGAQSCDDSRTEIERDWR